MKEVEDCLAWSGARPVEWLLAHAEVDRRWCLIHATHMTEAETDRFAASGAVAGLCPITEANLGDGMFDARRFLNAGGRFGIGSDSNVLIGVADELRQLEYSQRLARRERNVLGKANGSTGRRLFDEALRGGAQALGAGPAGIAAGHAADLVSLDAGHPTLAGKARRRHPRRLDLRQWRQGRLRLGARAQAGRGRPPSSARCDRGGVSRRHDRAGRGLARMDAQPASLHQRILADISERIVSGDWPPGHRIPFEHELSAEYQCSRMTVNKALSQLAKSGLIERRRRSGSFVTPAALASRDPRNPRHQGGGAGARPALSLRADRAQDPPRDGRRPAALRYRRRQQRGRAVLPPFRRQKAVLPGRAADQPRGRAGSRRRRALPRSRPDHG